MEPDDRRTVSTARRIYGFLSRLVVLFVTAVVLSGILIVKFGPRNIVVTPGILALVSTWVLLLIPPRTRRIVRNPLASGFLTLTLLTLLCHTFIVDFMSRRQSPGEQTWSVECRSPTGRYDAVLSIKSRPWGHSYRLRTSVSIRNVCRPGLIFALDPHGDMIIPGDGPAGAVYFSPHEENRIIWSAHENAVAAVRPDGRGVVFAYPDSVEGVNRILNLDSETRRRLDLLAGKQNPQVAIVPHGFGYTIKPVVVENIPEQGAETVIAGELSLSPELLGAMPAAPFETDMPLAMAREGTDTPNIPEKYAACHSLWKHGVTDWCVPALEDPDPVVRWWAAMTVGGNPDAEPVRSNRDLAVSRLAECLTPGDESLLGAAWWALTKLKPEVKASSIEEWQVYRRDRSEAVAYLLDTLDRGRVSAVAPLAELVGESAIDPILDAYENHPEVDWSDRVVPRSPGLPLTRSQEQYVVSGARETIERLMGYSDVLRIYTVDVRLIWTMCRQYRTAELAEALASRQESVRWAALLALGRRESDEALRILRETEAGYRIPEGLLKAALERRDKPGVTFDEEPDVSTSHRTSEDPGG